MKKYPNEIKEYDKCSLIFYADRKLTEDEKEQAYNKFLNKHPNFSPKRGQVCEIDYESLEEL